MNNEAIPVEFLEMYNRLAIDFVEKTSKNALNIGFNEPFKKMLENAMLKFCAENKDEFEFVAYYENNLIPHNKVPMGKDFYSFSDGCLLASVYKQKENDRKLLILADKYLKILAKEVLSIKLKGQIFNQFSSYTAALTYVMAKTIEEFFQSEEENEEINLTCYFTYKFAACVNRCMKKSIDAPEIQKIIIF